MEVRGKLGNQWSDWFEGMAVTSEGAVTVITGEIPDQPALHGLLVRIRDLGLPLISVERIETGEKSV
ncbi:MAG: hypothetical protein GY866_07665 [Proteobacteria bacterium]|nr:hypothetical protein [Pseudomonadota bacterium]